MSVIRSRIPRSPTRSARDPLGVEAPPVVGDGERDLVRVAPQLDLDCARFAVADRVGDCFLGHAVEAVSTGSGSRVSSVVRREGDLHAAALLEVVGESFERGDEAEVVEHGGAEIDRELADAGECASDEVSERVCRV